MPMAAPDSLTVMNADERLTTGEAAKLLSCSRQHVVDMCMEGLLPFTWAGRHRRVLRRDVEAVRRGSDELSRSERRSLWLAHVVAGKLLLDPDRYAGEARLQLERMRLSARGQALAWLDDWGRLLDGPVDQLVARMTERSLRGCDLRQNSPFAHVLSSGERDAALAAFVRHDAQRSSG